ncbi:hypothetical protein KL918_002892 [Ogataea parapolymorpha]|nr:hypothetical protein KL918_002892 [Ogataea parapolymorpha]KAG7871839.1 hypothetical protein KL916_003689 [Ogataea parapolymorpha]
MSQFLLGTQAQAQIEEWEAKDQERDRLELLQQKYAMRAKEAPRSRRSGPVRKKPKIKSLGDQMSKKHGKKNENIAILLALSGRKRKAKDIIRNIARIEESAPEQPPLLHDISLVYSREEWTEVRDEILRSLPKLSKSAKMTLELVSAKYNEQPATKQLWQESSAPPVVFSRDEILSLYDFESDEKTFVASQSDDEDLVVTLSQVIRPEERSVPCTPEEDYGDCEVSWTTYESHASASRKIQQRRQVYEVLDEEPEVSGTHQDPIELSSETDAEQACDASIVVVESSPVGEGTFKLDELDALQPMRATATEQEVPDSDPEPPELLAEQQAPLTAAELDFGSFTTAQLKLQIQAWGLKPAKSRKQMVDILTSSLRLIDRRQLLRQKEGVLQLSQADLDRNYTEHVRMEETFREVRSVMFSHIRRLLKEEKTLYRDILLLRPINFSDVMALLDAKGVQLEPFTVRACLDEMGVSFVVRDNDTANETAEETED